LTALLTRGAPPAAVARAPDVGDHEGPDDVDNDGSGAEMTEKPDQRPPSRIGVSPFFRSVRTRIIASYLILLTLGTLLSVLVVRQILIVRLEDRIDSQLTQEVQEFRRLASEGVDPRTGRPFGRDVDRLFTVFLSRNVPAEGEELIAIPRLGPPRYRYSERAQRAVEDGGFDPALLDRWRTLGGVDSGEIDSPSGPVSYLAVPVERGGATLGSFVVANFTAEEREEVDAAVSVLAAVSGGVLIVGTLLAFFAAGRVLAPLRTLRDAAQSITASDLTRRIDVEGHDEIAELARTFNAMLDRLEDAFRSQREFIRDAGHELRTPITIIRGHLELLATESGDHSETAAIVTAELDRMSRFVDDLMLLARAERPDFLDLRTVALGSFTRDLVSKAESLGNRNWVLDATSERVVVGDPHRLTQAMINLADNAVHHTTDGDEIGIGSAVRGHTARLWVRDTGVGVAPGDRQRIFERFQRGRGTRRYEGSGLGLSIARAIAEAHGGWIELSSEQGQGARFEMIFSVDPEPAPVGRPGEAVPA
jgi:signal transduction histidine kinase